MSDYTFSGKKPPHISFSQINLGLCPFKYLHCRLIGDMKERNNAMDLGSLVHQIIYAYTDICVKNRTEGDYEILCKIIDSEFDKNEYSEEIYKEAREICINFGEREGSIDFSKILDYEKRKNVEIGIDSLGKKIIIQVVIDRVNFYRADKGTVLEIIDYKNQLNIITKTDIDKHDQLNLYKMIAARYLYPNNDFVKIGIWHTRYNFVRWGELKTVKDCAVEFDNTEHFLKRQWERLQNAKEYPPVKGPACFDYGQCSVMAKGECPLWTKKQTEAMYVSESIDDKVNAYRKMKLDIENLRKQIKKHFEQTPNKEIGGKMVGFKKSVTSAYFVKPWYKYCEDHEIKIDDITIAQTEAEKAIKRFKKPVKMNENEQKEISIMIRQKVKTDFKI